MTNPGIAPEGAFEPTLSPKAKQAVPELSFQLGETLLNTSPEFCAKLFSVDPLGRKFMLVEGPKGDDSTLHVLELTGLDSSIIDEILVASRVDALLGPLRACVVQPVLPAQTIEEWKTSTLELMSGVETALSVIRDTSTELILEMKRLEHQKELERLWDLGDIARGKDPGNVVAHHDWWGEEKFRHAQELLGSASQVGRARGLSLEEHLCLFPVCAGHDVGRHEERLSALDPQKQAVNTSRSDRRHGFLTVEILKRAHAFDAIPETFQRYVKGALEQHAQRQIEGIEDSARRICEVIRSYDKAEILKSEKFRSGFGIVDELTKFFFHPETAHPDMDPRWANQDENFHQSVREYVRLLQRDPCAALPETESKDQKELFDQVRQVLANSGMSAEWASLMTDQKFRACVQLVVEALFQDPNAALPEGSSPDIDSLFQRVQAVMAGGIESRDVPWKRPDVSRGEIRAAFAEHRTADIGALFNSWSAYAAFHLAFLFEIPDADVVNDLFNDNTGIKWRMRFIRDRNSPELYQHVLDNLVDHFTKGTLGTTLRTDYGWDDNSIRRVLEA